MSDARRFILDNLPDVDVIDGGDLRAIHEAIFKLDTAVCKFAEHIAQGYDLRDIDEKIVETLQKLNILSSHNPLVLLIYAKYHFCQTFYEQALLILKRLEESHPTFWNGHCYHVELLNILIYQEKQPVRKEEYLQQMRDVMQTFFGFDRRLPHYAKPTKVMFDRMVQIKLLIDSHYPKPVVSETKHASMTTSLILSFMPPLVDNEEKTKPWRMKAIVRNERFESLFGIRSELLFSGDIETKVGCYKKGDVSVSPEFTKQNPQPAIGTPPRA